MPRYIYTAKSQPNKTIQGNIEAESEPDAINKLTQLGYYPISISAEELSLDKRKLFRFERFKNKDMVLFTSQLSTLIDSGVNIINAINIISHQTSNRHLKATLNDVIDRIKDGQSLSASLSAHPALFSHLYSSMISTGEASGNLKFVLSRLSDFLLKEEEFKNSLRASLTYPFFVLVVGILTVLTLLIFVIPKLVAMFEDMGQVLPLPTRMLINSSDFLHHYGWIILAVILAITFFLRRIQRNPQGRIFWDRLKLKTAIFGQIILKTQISHLMRTLSLLISGGLPIVAALEISGATVGNQILKSEIKRFKDRINEGSSFSAALKTSKFFTDFVTSIIAIGEETGSLEKSLTRIADDYENEVDRTLKTLMRLLEPIIILVMGLVVGFIVLSMLLPIFQINLIVG